MHAFIRPALLGALALALAAPTSCSEERARPTGSGGGGGGNPDDPFPGPRGDASPDASGDAGLDAAPPTDTRPAPDTASDSGPGTEDAPPAPDAAPPECVLNSDCPVRQVCRSGACGPECREDRDCEEPGELCHSDLCQGPGAHCLGGAGCLVGELCFRGRCKGAPVCIFEADCEPGEDCVNGDCVEQVAEGEGEDPCPARAGVYGDDCDCAAQCGNGLCLGTANPGGGVCTRACQNDGQCPGIDVCAPLGGASFCAPNDSGEQCDGPEECNLGLCINNPAQQESVCGVPCPDHTKCPQAMGCGAVLTAQGNVVWACVPVGGDCDRAADCPTNRCLPELPDDQNGYCTNDCRPENPGGDCVLGAACCGVLGPNGMPVAICVRGGCP